MVLRFRKLQPESPNYLRLDALRIIASLAVVHFHWRGSMGWQPAIEAMQWMDAWHSFVDLFFVISGFIIAAVYSTRLNSLRQYGDFLKKRFLRLAPLHYVTLGLYVAIGVVTALHGISPKEPAKYDMTCVVPNILFLQSFGLCGTTGTFNFPSWSISAEAFCYVTLPFLLLLYRHRPWLPAALGAGLILTLYFMETDAAYNSLWHEWTWDYGWIRAFAGFSLGVGFYGLRDRLGKIPGADAWMTVSLAALLLAGLAPSSFGITPILAYAVGLFAIAADARRPAGPLVRALAPWGQLTYSSYMLHAPMMTVFFALILDNILHLDAMMKFVAVCASYPLLLLVSYFSFTFFEDPIRRLRFTRAPAARPVPDPAKT